MGTQNLEKWRFCTPTIWVITSKNEGCGFPWLTIGLYRGNAEILGHIWIWILRACIAKKARGLHFYKMGPGSSYQRGYGAPINGRKWLGNMGWFHPSYRSDFTQVTSGRRPILYRFDHFFQHPLADQLKGLPGIRRFQNFGGHDLDGRREKNSLGEEKALKRLNPMDPSSCSECT